MLRTNDDWERLVAAVLRKEQYRELCYLSEDSSSECSSSFCSLNSSDNFHGLNSPFDDNEDLKMERVVKRLNERRANQHPGSGKVPWASHGEMIAAGWPGWLVEVAGEAINGLIPRRSDTFEKLEKIGEGMHSHVYRCRDLVEEKIVVLKRVKFDTLNPASVRFMAREIHILRRLDHPNIIKL